MVIHSAVRRTLLTTVIRLFVLSMSAMDVLREARLQSAMRKERSAAIYHAVHVGPGVFDDLAFLLDMDQRAQHSSFTLAAFDARFQSVFRLSVADFLFVRRRIARMLGHRRERRGRKRLSVDLTMAAALMYLGHGGTYLSTALMIRNGISEASAIRPCGSSAKPPTSNYARS